MKTKSIRQTVTLRAAPEDVYELLIFTQRGVPEHQYSSIREGWIEFYWEPMKKMLEK